LPSFDFEEKNRLIFYSIAICSIFFKFVHIISYHIDTFLEQTKLRKISPIFHSEIDTLSAIGNKAFNANSLKYILLRAARLLLAKKKIDFVPPEVEVKDILNLISKFPKRYNVDQVILNARTKSNDIKKLIIQLRLQNRILEEFLFKKFLVEQLQGFKKRVAEISIIQDTTKFHRTINLITIFIMLVILIILFVGLFYGIYWFKTFLGSGSFFIWLTLVLGSIGEDILLVQLFKIWLKYVFVYGSIHNDITSIVKQLKIRNNLILMRSFGVIRSYKWLIQHLNPACRVARSYPLLNVSRLLISINDFDIVNQQKKKMGFNSCSHTSFFLLIGQKK
jgi:hypothetical protein